MMKQFQIRISKVFIKDGWPDKELLDFKFSLLVNYFYNNQNVLVMSVDILFDLIPAIDWDNPRLRQYLIAACENHENSGEEKQPLDTFEEPTLHRY